MTESNNTGIYNAVSPSDLLDMERTKLAMERTKLANQRTLLAYIRTSLACFAGAAALIEFFEQSRKLQMTTYITIMIGIVFLISGFYSYNRTKRSMKEIELIK
jgi:putative membrane protein